MHHPDDNKIPLCDEQTVKIIEKLSGKYPSISDSKETYNRIIFNAVPADQQVAYMVDEYNNPPQELHHPMKALLNNTKGVAGRVHSYWIENTIEKNEEFLDKYKICINSSIQGSEDPEDYNISLVDKGIAPNWSRITVKTFDDKEEAMNCYKYLNSYFIRCLIKAGSGSRDRIGHTLMCFVPDLINYKEENIDWYSEDLEGEIKKYFNI